jgi:hypothetical protein
MASAGTTPTSSSRPSPSRPVLFPKHSNIENNEDDYLKVPTRVITTQNGTSQETTCSEPATAYSAVGSESPDAFESADNDDTDLVRASVDIGELPIELVSLCDR